MIDLILKGLGHIFGAIIGAVVLLIKALFSNMLLVIANIGFTFLDFIQSMFRRLAGLDVENVIIKEEGAEKPLEGADILIKLLNSQIVKNTIIALAILAVCLLFIATFVQLARVEFTEEGAKNSKTPIITQSLKALAMFVIVPATCFIGVTLSNLVLKMVDSATRGGNSTTVSGLIFKVGAYNANIIREGNTNGIFPTPKSPLHIGSWIVSCILHGLDSIGNDTDSDLYSAYASVDENSWELNDKANSILPIELTGDREQRAQQLDNFFATNGEDNIAADNGGSLVGGTVIIKGLTKVNYSSIPAVRYFYNIMEFNFLMVLIAIPFAMKALFHTCFGLIMRIYNVLILFVISPPMIALMPLDGGNAYKGWRQKFIGNVISAYGTVAGLNLFFQILPLVNQVEFFETNNAVTKFTMGFYNYLAQLLFVLVGCFMIQDISKMISGFIGAEDAMASGEGMSKKIGEKAKKAGMAVVGAAALAVGGGAAVVSRFKAGIAKGAGGESEDAAKRVAPTSRLPGKLGEASVGIQNKIKSKSDAYFKKRANKLMGGDDSADVPSDPNGTKQDAKPAENGGVADKVEPKDKGKKAGSAETVDKSADSAGDKKEEVESGTSNPAAGTEAQRKFVDKYTDSSKKAWVVSERGKQLAKNMAIQMIAGSGMGKAMNEMTGGMFQVFGGKGVNQLDGQISGQSDIAEEIMFKHGKYEKSKKQAKAERAMGDVFEVVSAWNQRMLNNEMAQNNIQNTGQAMIDHVEFREDALNRMANVFAQALANAAANGGDTEKAKSEFISGMTSMGFNQSDAEKIANAMANSGANATFLASADEMGTIKCSALYADGKEETVSASQEQAAAAIGRAVKDAISSVTSKVRIDDQKAANDGFISKFTKNLSIAQQKQVGGKTLDQLNADMHKSATSEKSERADIKAILKILQQKLH